MSEMWREQVERLEMMASGKGDWDLSPNDRAAIKAALDLICDAFDVTKEAERYVAAQPDLQTENERLRAALEAVDSGIMWMAEKYAESGGSGGPEMRDYNEVKAIMDDALKPLARAGENPSWEPCKGGDVNQCKFRHKQLGQCQLRAHHGGMHDATPADPYREFNRVCTDCGQAWRGVHECPPKVDHAPPK
jgi:hypothetical protein